MTKRKAWRERRKRRRHIREMRDQLKRHAGQFDFLCSGNLGSLEAEETFLEHILAVEGVGAQPLFDLLLKSGVGIPPPESLDDTQIHSKLWDVINGMALLEHYLSSTDHLSDRQLYELLWSEILREPTTICPNNPNAAWYIDILGGCSDEDLQLRLKYYADEDERLDWAERFPDDVIPPHESPAYDRDRHLPVFTGGCMPAREAC